MHLHLVFTARALGAHACRAACDLARAGTTVIGWRLFDGFATRAFPYPAHTRFRVRSRLICGWQYCTGVPCNLAVPFQRCSAVVLGSDTSYGNHVALVYNTRVMCERPCRLIARRLIRRRRLPQFSSHIVGCLSQRVRTRNFARHSMCERTCQLGPEINSLPSPLSTASNTSTPAHTLQKRLPVCLSPRDTRFHGIAAHSCGNVNASGRCV